LSDFGSEDQRVALGQRNPVLGVEIRNLICEELGGRKVARKEMADWGRFGIGMAVGEFSLPKTSASYEVPIDQLPRLLDWVRNHP
jgi:hypothetical protein